MIRSFKIIQSRFGLLALGLLTASTLAAIAPRAAADGIDPLDVNRRRTEDPLSSQNSGTDDLFFDIMHRAQLGNIRSLPEYSQDQQESIGSEASDFRTRQRALILQNQNQQAEGVLAPSSSTAAPAATQP